MAHSNLRRYFAASDVSRRSSRGRYRPRIEHLEDRVMPAVYDLVGDFSFTNNPNNGWTYGQYVEAATTSQPVFSPLAMLSQDLVPDVDGWGGDPFAVDATPVLSHPITGSDVDGSIFGFAMQWKINEVNFNPDLYNVDHAVARFTVPEAKDYLIKASFTDRDAEYFSTGYEVRLNGNIRAQGLVPVSGPAASYQETRYLQAGDVIDFVVAGDSVSGIPGLLQSVGVQAALITDLPAISLSDLAQNEGNSGDTTFTFHVSLSNPSPLATTVDFATADGTASATTHDYAMRSGALTIPAWETTGTFAITVHGDLQVEGNEYFFVNLSNPTNATIADGQAKGTIQKDDLPSIVYVDDGWFGLADDVDPDGPTGPAAAIGTDAFSSIQDAVNAVLADGTVVVYSGSYAENVVVNKSLTMFGAGVGTSVIQAPSLSSGQATVTVTNAARVFMTGFSITGLGAAGTGVALLDGRLTLDGFDIANNGVGVSVTGGYAILNAGTTNNNATGVLLQNATADMSDVNVNDFLDIENAGLLNVNGTVDAQNLKLDGGQVDGVGTLSIFQFLNWKGGTMRGAGVTVVAGLGAQGIIDGPANLDGRRLVNVASTTMNFVDLSMRNGAVIENRLRWDIAGDVSILNGGGPASTFINSGTFVKSGGTGVSKIEVPFNNNGTVRIMASALSTPPKTLEFTKTYDQSLAGASLLVDENAKLINSGEFNWSGGAIKLGEEAIVENKAGAVFNLLSDDTIESQQAGGISNSKFINSGTLWKSVAGINASVISQDVDLENKGTVVVDVGTLILRCGGFQTGSFIVAAGANLRFEAVALQAFMSMEAGASWNGPGLYTVAGDVSFDELATVNPANLEILSHSLKGLGTVNAQTVLWSGGLISGIKFNAFNSEISGAGEKTLSQRAILKTMGETKWLAGKIVLDGDVQLFNTGTFRVMTGDTLRRETQVVDGITLAPIIRNAGLFIKEDSPENIIEPVFINGGGTLKLAAAATPLSLTFENGVKQIDGRTLLNGGTLRVWGDGFESSTLFGVSLIDLGGTTGRLITTNYSQSEKTRLVMYVGGLNDFSRIKALGTATLAGTLQLVFTPAFANQVDTRDVFELISFGTLRGSFDVIEDNVPFRVVKKGNTTQLVELVFKTRPARGRLFVFATERPV